MQKSKLHSTLDFHSSKGDKYRYEIFQSHSDSGYFAVIYTQQDIDTEKFSTSPVWVQIEGHLRLTSTSVPGAENECESYFKSSVR